MPKDEAPAARQDMFRFADDLGPEKIIHVTEPGLGLRGPASPILDVSLLRLWLRKRCGLGLNHKLPFLD